MKNNFKKVTAIVLSSLGILASAPSAFCAPKNKIIKLTPAEKIQEATEPSKCDSELAFPEPKFSKPLQNLSGNFNPNIIKKNNVMLNTPNALGPNLFLKDSNYIQDRIRLRGTVAAPLVGPIVNNQLFRSQTEITSLSLPKAVIIDDNAFEGCTNLNELFLGSFMEYVSPKAFEGCNPNLKIVWYNLVYTIPEFLSVFASKEETSPTYKYAVNTEEETSSFYNITKR